MGPATPGSAAGGRSHSGPGSRDRARRPALRPDREPATDTPTSRRPSIPGRHVGRRPPRERGTSITGAPTGPRSLGRPHLPAPPTDHGPPPVQHQPATDTPTSQRPSIPGQHADRRPPRETSITGAPTDPKSLGRPHLPAPPTDHGPPPVQHQPATDTPTSQRPSIPGRHAGRRPPRGTSITGAPAGPESLGRPHLPAPPTDHGPLPTQRQPATDTPRPAGGRASPGSTPVVPRGGPAGPWPEGNASVGATPGGRPVRSP